MPLYEYQCKDCNEVTEINHRISEIGTPQECGKCKSTNTEKVILSAPALCDPIRIGVRKPDGSMKDTLQKIHERTPGSQLDKVM